MWPDIFQWDTMMPEPPVESSLQRLLERQKNLWSHCGVPSEELNTSSAIVNRLFFPVSMAGLVDGSQRVNISRAVIEGNAEDLPLPLGTVTTVNPAWTEPLRAATTVTPAWTEPLGAVSTVTPAWTEPLGAATTVTPAWTEPLGAVTTVTPARTVSLGAAMTVTPAWTVPLAAATTVTSE